jgi:hypothetical protein
MREENSGEEGLLAEASVTDVGLQHQAAVLRLNVRSTLRDKNEAAGAAADGQPGES